MLTENRPTKATALEPLLKRKPSMHMLWSLIPDRDGRAPSMRLGLPPNGSPGRSPGARLAIFEPDEGGSHLLALENPAKFNRLLSESLAAASSSGDLRLSRSDPTPSNESEGVTTWTP
jgi:hypothetical protein